jgi:hypothetical protein
MFRASLSVTRLYGERSEIDGCQERKKKADDRYAWSIILKEALVKIANAEEKKKSLRGSKGDVFHVFWVVTLCRLANTDHRPEDNRRRVLGVSGAVRGLLDIGAAIGLLLVGATDCRRPKHEAFRVACNQGGRCGNTL